MSRTSIVTLLVLIGIFIYAKSLPPQIGDVKEASDVKAIIAPTEISTPTSAPTPTFQPNPTTNPIPTSTPKPTSDNTQQNTSLSDLIYPGATQVRRDDDSVTLESSDSPDTITEWYKNKIKSLSMNAKSFVQTKTNGNVLNKLVGDNGKTEVQIEITEKANETVTKITVAIGS